jgi:hypothetical protein
VRSACRRSAAGRTSWSRAASMRNWAPPNTWAHLGAHGRERGDRARRDPRRDQPLQPRGDRGDLEALVRCFTEPACSTSRAKTTARAATRSASACPAWCRTWRDAASARSCATTSRASGSSSPARHRDRGVLLPRLHRDRARHWGRYADRFVRADGAWRIAHRKVRVDGATPTRAWRSSTASAGGSA